MMNSIHSYMCNLKRWIWLHPWNHPRNPFSLVSPLPLLSNSNPVENSLILNGGVDSSSSSGKKKNSSDQNGDSNGQTDVNSESDSTGPKKESAGSTGSTTLTDNANNQETPPADQLLITDVGLSYQYSQVLLGTLMAHAEILQDEQGYPCIFYIFNDLSIRSSGKYRLKFQLFTLPSVDQRVKKATLCAVSNVFTVHSPRTFPGMTDSTELTKCLARQGVRLHVRSSDVSVRNEAY